MDTYINTDEVLVQTKSELSKEYFFLKKRIQSEKEQSDSSNLSGDLIYDLVDKQFLLIQVQIRYINASSFRNYSKNTQSSNQRSQFVKWS